MTAGLCGAQRRYSLSDFVLIHGGAHGPWCWERVIPFLTDSGRVGQVVAVDLPVDALTVSGKPLQDIGIADYLEGVLSRIEQARLRDIVLVGHSMAGIVMPAVAHRISKNIRRILYLATSNPPVGQSIADLMQHPLSPLSRGLDFEEMFCNDLDEETAQWLTGNLREDPPLPVVEKLAVSALPKGLPSTYIVCERDRALPVEYQLEQARSAQVDEIVRLDSGHCAFASRPEELAELLLRYA